MRKLVDLAAGAASGVLAGLAFPPAALSPLVFVCLLPLLLRIRATGGRRTVLPFLAFGVTFFAVGLGWLHTVLGPLGAAGLGVVLTVLFVWPVAAATGWLVRRGWSLLLAAPMAFLVSDWLRTWVFTGFPWLFLAHPLADYGVLIQIADVFGAWGLTAFVVLANAAIVEAAFRVREGRGRRALLLLAAPAAVAIAFLAYGLWRPGTIAIEDGPKVLLVQGNIPQDEKKEIWQDADPATVIYDRHLDLTLAGLARDPDVEVIVWPETMFPYLVPDANELVPPPEGGPAPRVVPKFREMSQMFGYRPAIVGALSRTGVDDKRNSVFLILPGGEVGARHDKRRIVPGGEYVPLRDLLPAAWVEKIGEAIATRAGFVPNLTEGGDLVLLDAAGVRFAPLVCYETCYPGLCREAVQGGADVLLNVSNYGWFPETSEPEQALQQAIFRAVETRRPLAVAANTGISCVVDPVGRVTKLVVDGRVKDVTGTLAAVLPLSRAGSVYVSVGDLLPLASIFTLFAALAGAIIDTCRDRGRESRP